MNCLYCYRPLTEEEQQSAAGRAGFHTACSKRFFGEPVPPELAFDNEDIKKLAEQVVKSKTAVTGVQPKLSLSIDKTKGSQQPERFTIVGLWGEFILKPQTDHYPNLPELEDVTMHLAQLSGIKTVEHSLVRLRSGQLAYITKRIDRLKPSRGGQKARKIHMEDMCQLTERLTEHKYRGSHEQVAKAILKYSVNPGLDVIGFYEQVVFSFLAGNSDMHLKNFSLIQADGANYVLSPAYDLVATRLVLSEDPEELALTLNGKKRKLKRSDFEDAIKAGGVHKKAIENLFLRFSRTLPLWPELIKSSFLPNSMKADLLELTASRAKILGI